MSRVYILYHRNNRAALHCRQRRQYEPYVDEDHNGTGEALNYDQVTCSLEGWLRYSGGLQSRVCDKMTTADMTQFVSESQHYTAVTVVAY